MKTIWIIDGAYLLKSAPGSFDYLKLKAFLESKNRSNFIDSYYLNSTPNPPTDQQDSFHTWLKLAPPDGPKMRVLLYKLKTMSNECPKCHEKFERTVQKGVDVGIATLMIKLAYQGHYERLILSAGDGDFEDSINYIKTELKKELWIAGFKNSISADLQSYSDNVIWLDDNQIWQKIMK